MFPIPGKKKVQTVIVSLKDGKLRFCKSGERHGTTYNHQQVLQLVKSRSKDQRLGILLEGQSKKDYLFNSMQVGFVARKLERKAKRENIKC